MEFKSKILTWESAGVNMNITDLTVKNDYCIGCGVCAGVCPHNNLHMDWSPKGELIPYTTDLCNDNCSICVDICPFNNHEINQDDIASSLFSKTCNIKYNEYAGYYLNCYVGFQKDTAKRLKSASGGLATSFLSSLIEESIVDRVAAVGIFEDSNRMFDFKILSNSDEVYSCAGSAYYPVEISKILKEIIKEKEEFNYAVIALPCVAYALRLAMDKIPKLKNKIKIIASLTCGQLQNRFCTELLSLESGIKVNELSTMNFRQKSENNPAINYMQVATDKNGNEGIPQSNQGLPSHLWYYQYFKQNACNFCDDVFGELADITFMDAWLPKYINDYRGTSLVIARTPMVKDLLENSQECALKEIPVTKIIESQMGIIQKKRTLLKGKLYKSESSNSLYPKKRVKPDINVYDDNKEFIDLTTEIQKLSKELWPKYRLDGSTKEFWNDLKHLESKINKYERKIRIKNLIINPKRFFKKISGS